MVFFSKTYYFTIHFKVMKVSNYFDTKKNTSIKRAPVWEIKVGPKNGLLLLMSLKWQGQKNKIKKCHNFTSCLYSMISCCFLLDQDISWK